MTPIRVRAAGPAEYPALVDLVLREQPHLERPEFAPLLHDDTIVRKRFVVSAYDEDVPVGCGFLLRLPHHPEERRGIRIVVAASHRDRGIGHLLMQSLLQEAGETVRDLRTMTYDDDARSVAIAEHWGFDMLQRSFTSRLDLAHASAPAPPDGVTLGASTGLDLPDLAAVDAMLDASQTNPERAHSGAFDLDGLRAMVAQDETPILVLARVDGAPAALSFGAVAGDLAYVAFTGVDPVFRGRGLARLAKQAFHVEAGGLGARWVDTENEEGNVGIRRINAELGYHVLFGVLRMRRLRPDGPANR